MQPTGRSAMPTAARAAAAASLGLLGWYAAGIAAQFFIEGRPPDYFIYLCILTGLALGWLYLGLRAGRGYILAIGHGLTAAFGFCLCVLFVMSFAMMVNQAMRLRFDGPMEAAVAVFGIMVEQAADFADVTLLASIFLGGVVCAWITEFFARRYP